MAEINPQVSEEPVCSAWQRAVQGALGVFLLATVGLLARYYPATRQNQQNQLVCSVLAVAE